MDIVKPDPTSLTTNQLLRAYVDSEVQHLKELMLQHDKMTAMAIEKSDATYAEKFTKVNEFRSQQNDLIQTFAKGDETRGSIRSLTEKFEQNIKSVSERFDKGQAAMIEKINTAELHLTDKINSTITVQIEKFASTDKQMQTLIDANAEISNRGLRELNEWKSSMAGSIRVIMTVGGFISALVLALIIAFIKTKF